MVENKFGQYLRELRVEKGLGINQLATYSGISNAQISRIETGSRGVPKPETIKRLADALKVPYKDMMREAGYLIDQDEEKQTYYALNKKDERDLAKDLERMMEELDSDSSLAFMGEPMDDEDRELLRISLENTLRMSREMAKKKFTPKKYRK